MWSVMKGVLLPWNPRFIIVDAFFFLFFKWADRRVIHCRRCFSWALVFIGVERAELITCEKVGKRNSSRSEFLSGWGSLLMGRWWMTERVDWLVCMPEFLDGYVGGFNRPRLVLALLPIETQSATINIISTDYTLFDGLC